MDVRKYRDVNCDINHFLVTVKFKIEAGKLEKIRIEKKPKAKYLNVKGYRNKKIM